MSLTQPKDDKIKVLNCIFSYQNKHVTPPNVLSQVIACLAEFRGNYTTYIHGILWVSLLGLGATK